MSSSQFQPVLLAVADADADDGIPAVPVLDFTDPNSDFIVMKSKISNREWGYTLFRQGIWCAHTSKDILSLV